MLKLKPVVPQILGQLGIVILQAMRLVNHQDLPLNRRQLGEVVCDEHLWRGNLQSLTKESVG